MQVHGRRCVGTIKGGSWKSQDFWRVRETAISHLLCSFFYHHPFYVLVIIPTCLRVQGPRSAEDPHVLKICTYNMVTEAKNPGLDLDWSLSVIVVF